MPCHSIMELQVLWENFVSKTSFQILGSLSSSNSGRISREITARVSREHFHKRLELAFFPRKRAPLVIPRLKTLTSSSSSCFPKMAKKLRSFLVKNWRSILRQIQICTDGFSGGINAGRTDARPLLLLVTFTKKIGRKARSTLGETSWFLLSARNCLRKRQEMCSNQVVGIIAEERGGSSTKSL